MGWAYGTNAEGREVGYGVEATCDLDGCEAAIDRGLYFVCGGMHDGGEHGCGRYFCAEHLFFTNVGQLCTVCSVLAEDVEDTSDPMVGRAVVACPGCSTERWHGYGPCSTCGAPGTAGGGTNGG